MGELATIQEQAIAQRERVEMPAEVAERVLVHGDLAKLDAGQRLAFYKARCDAAGLDPRGRPFEYITLQGKLTLYAKKECAEQLNGMHGLSHTILSRQAIGDLYEVAVRVTSPAGRTSEDIGVVVIQGLRGADLANAMMKAITKAKRRATLSFCGLGDMPDESELETIPDIRRCTPTGQPAPYQNNSGHGKGMYASPEQTEAYLKAMGNYIESRNQRWLDRWQQDDGSFPASIKRDLINKWQADNHLVKWAVETGRLDPAIPTERGVKAAQVGRFTGVIYHRSKDERKALAKELERYCDEQERLQTDKLQREHPELFEPEDLPDREPGDDDEWVDVEAEDNIQDLPYEPGANG